VFLGVVCVPQFRGNEEVFPCDDALWCVCVCVCVCGWVCGCVVCVPELGGDEEVFPCDDALLLCVCRYRIS
jgi:hypothetical protein